MTTVRTTALAASLASAFLVAGCGGDATTAASMPPLPEDHPRLRNSISLTVSEGEPVDLKAADFCDTGMPVSWFWDQKDNGAPALVLTETDDIGVSVSLPALESDTAFEIGLSITDVDGHQVECSASVMVLRTMPDWSGLQVSPRVTDATRDG